MMKKIVSLLVLVAVWGTATAQYRPGGYPGAVERMPTGVYGPDTGSHVEIGFGLNHFADLSFSDKDGAGHTERPARPGLYGEYRVAVIDYLDLGIQLSTTLGKGSLHGPADPRLDFEHDAFFWQGAGLLLADYKALPYSTLNPFIGLGIGPGIGYAKDKDAGSSEWFHAFVLSPRIGVEVFDHLRIGFQYQKFTNGGEHFSTGSFYLGWTFDPRMTGSRGKMSRR